MNRDLENIRRLAGALRENLAKCAADPDEDPVHDTRTGTRRLQATVESVLREIAPGEEGDPVRDAAKSLLRLLKKARRAAGPVRDLDVHRKLLEKLAKRAVGEPTKSDKEEEQGQPKAEPVLVDQPDALETPEAGRRASGLEQQAGDLDAWLKHRRAQLAHDLRDEAAAAAGKLDRRVADLEAALTGHAAGARRGEKKPPAVVALDTFARLAMEMQHLDAGNLHDFRKGAKKARYVAELAAQGDTQAEQVGKTLKKLQDEIGDWHDWLVLAEEAHAATGDDARDLLELIEGERDRHFVAAMKTAVRLRGRLMGEWLALTGPAKRPARRQRPRQLTKAS